MATLPAVLRFLAVYPRATYTVHLALIVKCVVDFRLVLIELFPPGVMAEALQVKIN